MKKYLFITNSTKPTYLEQISRDDIKLCNVRKPCIEVALSMGYEVFLGINRLNPQEIKCGYDIKLFNSSTYRSLFDFKSNLIAYKNLMAVLKENEIDVMHCHTPIGGLIGRLGGRRAKVKKVIYTAHGFHFYKGAPLINRTIIKWAEMWLAHYTDALITINQEDFEAAQKFKLRNNGRVYFMPSVGVDVSEYHSDNIDKLKIRASLGLNADDIVLISMGDLIKRKNYSTSIKAVAEANNSRLHYLICGVGPLHDELVDLSKKHGVDKQIHFLGFRTDVKELLQVSDIFLFTTYQEGLPRSMMEAMAAGLPCVASEIRGNVDLIENNKGGCLLKPDDVDGFARAINYLADNKGLGKQMGKLNTEFVEKFSYEKAKAALSDIYCNELART